jgi:hypothetical protein
MGEISLVARRFGLRAWWLIEMPAFHAIEMPHVCRITDRIVQRRHVCNAGMNAGMDAQPETLSTSEPEHIARTQPSLIGRTLRQRPSTMTFLAANSQPVQCGVK